MDSTFDGADKAQSLSPASASKNPGLRLPATCDPPSEQDPHKEAVWIVRVTTLLSWSYALILYQQIFGATGHMGRSLVRAATSHGDKVTSVGWSQEHRIEEMQSWQDSSSIGMLCDIRIRDTVDVVFKKSIEHWGRFDIVVK